MTIKDLVHALKRTGLSNEEVVVAALAYLETLGWYQVNPNTQVSLEDHCSTWSLAQAH